MNRYSAFMRIILNGVLGSMVRGGALPISIPADPFLTLPPTPVPHCFTP